MYVQYMVESGKVTQKMQIVKHPKIEVRLHAMKQTEDISFWTPGTPDKTTHGSNIHVTERRSAHRVH